MENAQQIKEAVKGYIVENFMFGNESEPIREDDSFIERGIIDSTGIMELIDYIENKYDISLDDKELVPENLDSLNNLSRFILSKK